MTILRHASATHVGRVRRLNEDAILSMPESGIWLVADGMGGHEAGDYASQTIVETVSTLPPDLPPADAVRHMRDALSRAHDQIRAEAARRGADTIGATVVALIVTRGHFAALWAGDSRLYRLRPGHPIELMTEDHSVVGALVATGRLTWDEAEAHPQSNAITRAVGVGEVLELDKVRGLTERGDRFLLCSDGLNRYAGFDRLERSLRDTPIEVVTDRLIKMALDGGGADNISAIVVDVV